MQQSRRNDWTVPLLVLALFLLLLVPLFAEQTKVFMDFLCYLAMALPFFQSLATGKLQFLSLIVISTVIHLVSDACSELDACVAAYEAARWADLDAYFTNYAMTHLLFVVSFKMSAVEIAVPILVFISLLSVNLGYQTLFLLLIGMVCFVQGILRLRDYYVLDLAGFVVSFLISAIIYFLGYEKRFFVFFYALAFAFATTVRRPGKHFLAFMFDGQGYEKVSKEQRMDLY